MTCLPKYMGAACVLLLGWPMLAQIGAPAGAKPTVIEVVVTDPDGRPIPETGVSLGIVVAPQRGGRLRPPAPQVLRTDLNGKCSIELPSGGLFRVTVWREGYLDADDVSQSEHVEVVQVDTANTVKVLVDLIQGASFRGTVYLDDGRRLPGAIVRLQAATLSWMGAVRGAAPKWLVAKTDEQGNYVFPMVPPSRYGMWIAPPAQVVKESLEVNDRNEWTGYGSVVWHSSVEEMRRIVPVDIAPGEDVRGYNVVLRKTRVYPFRGTLREWSGEPILHAKIAIRAEDEEPVTLLEPRPVNALTGDFEFPALPEGHYSLLVYRDDAAEAPPYAIPMEAGDGERQNPELGPVRNSRYVVSIPPWALVAGRVVIQRPELNASPAPAGQSGAPAPIRRNMDRWQPPASVQVSLTPAGPAVDTRADTLKLESAASADWHWMEFPAAWLPPGDYQFNVRAPAPWYVVSAWHEEEDLLDKWLLPLAARQYDAPAEFVVEIRQGGTALQGMIVNENDEPVPNGAMCAVAADPARRRQPGGAFCVRADGGGAYRSRWMSPGNWMVWGYTKKPHENPASPAFQDKYERSAQRLTVPEDGELGRIALLAVE